ncbi:hypothetical protein [Cognatishimia sp. F0-27]|uniref:hypothetical protein n=1 Tax=Cognatishimia sp. F0-27 TaxID=2816855 RepID=UPI001D0C37B1|nr:hypothetical protein [Cognatishimia sp. F0-27]MCC1491842.1 FG-GAP repeat protein [Cognatishimia sp. F0-27]
MTTVSTRLTAEISAPFTTDDSFGDTLAFIGDFNGDGFGDFVVGARDADRGLVSYDPHGVAYFLSYFQDVGAATIVYGTANGRPSTTDLQNPAPGTGFRINGSEPSQNFGASVSALGDVNGDGYADVLIGAPGTTYLGGADNGAAYIVFGRATPENPVNTVLITDLAGPASSRFFTTTPEERLGSEVFYAGDFNGDGFFDLGAVAQYGPAINTSAPNQPPNYIGGAGVGFILAGNQSGFSQSYSRQPLPANAFSFMSIGQDSIPSGNPQQGNNPTDFGNSADGGIDFNDDGRDDVIFGAPQYDVFRSENNMVYVTQDAGRAYVVFGANTDPGNGGTSGIDTNGLTGSNGFTFTGVRPVDAVGASVAAIGDFNGDGFDDFLIGAPGAAVDYNTYRTTRVYNTYYTPTFGTGSYTRTRRTYTNRYTRFYTPPGNYTMYGSYSPGYGYTAGGGFPMTEIRSYTNRSYGPYYYTPAPSGNYQQVRTFTTSTYTVDRTRETGQAYVIFGTDSGMPSDLTREDLNSAQGFVISGAPFIDDGIGANLGQTVAALGDINGDGFADIAIVDQVARGRKQDDPVDLTRVNVIFGTDAAQTSNLEVDGLDGTDGFRFVIRTGGTNGEEVLRSIDGGDINGDGFSDILIGRAAGFETNAQTNDVTSYVATGYVLTGGSNTRWSFIDWFVDGYSDGYIAAAYLPDEGFYIGDVTNDLIYGSNLVFGDYINGLAGNDTIFGLEGGDRILGGAGDDSVIGGPGNDDMEGGDDFDTLDFSGSASAVNVDFENNSATGQGTDTIGSFEAAIGTDQNDTLLGAESIGDRLEGRDGDDDIAGRTGDDTLLGGNGKDFVDGESGNDSLEGGANDDTLSGGADNDTLKGGAGEDTLFGGTGNDSVDGGSNADLIYAGGGLDFIDGGTNFDTIHFRDATARVEIWLERGDYSFAGETSTITNVEHVEGSGFNDLIVGTTIHDNILNGLGGMDLIVGLDGNDVINGGDDFDMVAFSAAPTGLTLAPLATAIMVDLSTGIAMGQGRDRLTEIEGAIGGLGGDRFIGDDATGNLFEGIAGNDTFVGGDGADTLRGGGDDDLFFADGGADSINGEAGFDTLSFAFVASAATVDLAAGTASSATTGADMLEQIEGVIGSALGDTLQGADAVANRIVGGDGADELSGRGGEDTLLGGDGNDSIDGDAEADNISGGAGNDTLNGGTGNDYLIGAGDNDTLRGDEGSDTLVGSGGDDRLEGGADADSLSGGSNTDRLVGGLGDDTINGGNGIDTAIYTGLAAAVEVNLETGIATGGAGSDMLMAVENVFGSAFDDVITGTALHGNRLEGSLGADTLSGLDGRDTLIGGDGADSLLGGADVDRLFGSDGADRLDGGEGRDFLTGGDDADTFVFSDITHTGVGIFARDEIEDFDSAEGDRIDVSGIDANTATVDDDAFLVVTQFTGTAGEITLLDIVRSGFGVTIASMDVDGDGVADGQIYIPGGAVESDFIL